MNKKVEMTDQEAKLFAAFKKQQLANLANHKPNTYGYAHASTPRQDFTQQVKQLLQAGVPKSNIYQEKYAGAAVRRPQLAKLQKKLKPGDIVAITRLNRMAESTDEALKMMRWFMSRKVKLHVLNIGVIDNTAIGQLIFTVFSAFADFERTQQRKKKNKKVCLGGRPHKYSKERMQLAYNLHYQVGKTLRQVTQMTGIPQSTLYDNFRVMRRKKIGKTSHHAS